jgi:glycosyltransferase involved in cell wall biosynthesis
MSAASSRTPRISVIVPAYNAFRFVGRALESILTQTMTDFELVVIDDGSTDGTGAIIDAYAARDPRMRVEHQANAGRPKALNRAIALARGNYIARMDADDIALPDRLQRQAAFLDLHPEVGIVGGSIKAIDETERKLNTFKYPVAPSAIRAQAATGSPMLIAGPTPMARREFLISLGGFRTTFEFAQDYDLALRALEKSDLANLDAVVVYYRFSSGQVSQKHSRRQSALAEVARISARLRKEGKPDPVVDGLHIDATSVERLGLDPAETERLRKLFLPLPT